MRTDAELLNHLVDVAPIVVDRLTSHALQLSRATVAAWTGLAVQTISDYCTGRLNIPVSFWQRILLHHLDLRIVHLILLLNCACEIYATELPPISSARAFFRQALELEGTHHAMMSRIVDIIADGRVDELDTESIEAYHDTYHDHRERDDRLHRYGNARLSRRHREPLGDPPMIYIIIAALVLLIGAALIYLLVWLVGNFRFDNLSCLCGYLRIRRVLILDSADRASLITALTAACPYCQAGVKDPGPWGWLFSNPQSEIRNGD